MTAAITGASPRWTARSSMEGLHPSMTASRRRVMRSAEDAQARVLLVAAAAAGDEEGDEEADRDDRQRRGKHAGAGGDPPRGLRGEREAPRPAPVPRAGGRGPGAGRPPGGP